MSEFLLLGSPDVSGLGYILLPDTHSDFAETSRESGVRLALWSKAYAPAGTEGEVEFRRLYVTGYHRDAVSFKVIPVVDNRMRFELKARVTIPAPKTGDVRRFQAVVPLHDRHPDYDVLFGLRGSQINVYLEASDPKAPWHLESVGFQYKPLARGRAREVAEAEVAS